MHGKVADKFPILIIEGSRRLCHMSHSVFSKVTRKIIMKEVKCAYISTPSVPKNCCSNQGFIEDEPRQSVMKQLPRPS